MITFCERAEENAVGAEAVPDQESRRRDTPVYAPKSSREGHHPSTSVRGTQHRAQGDEPRFGIRDDLEEGEDVGKTTGTSPASDYEIKLETNCVVV